MHAKAIIQDLLKKKCPTIHAKRRDCVASLVEAGRIGGLGLLKMSRVLGHKTALRHRIKCCDRLLSNPHLGKERSQIYRALNESVLTGQGRIAIIVDWSDLLTDGSAHVLRASAIVKGRAFIVYEEVHTGKNYGALKVHRKFLSILRTVLPADCQPILVTDAGFRATWFKLATELGYEWVGRIRNRDQVCAQGSAQWQGCKTLYPCATGRAQSLGSFMYVKSNPTPCRLVVFKKASKGRHGRTAFGKRARSAQNAKNRAAQVEPWLIAVSPGLAALSGKMIVALYAGRMQIEQTFRDVKNGQWGLGLTHSQTRKHKRLAILFLLGALITYALWLIGLAAARRGYQVCYGSKKKAPSTLSIISLARSWLREVPRPSPSKSELAEALRELASMVMRLEI
jgi:hypothetical protein